MISACGLALFSSHRSSLGSLLTGMASIRISEPRRQPIKSGETVDSGNCAPTTQRIHYPIVKAVTRILGSVMPVAGSASRMASVWSVTASASPQMPRTMLQGCRDVRPRDVARVLSIRQLRPHPNRQAYQQGG